MQSVPKDLGGDMTTQCSSAKGAADARLAYSQATKNSADGKSRARC